MKDHNRRLTGEIPLMDAEAAASFVGETDTVAVSGFGSVGYPKAIPSIIEESTHEYSLTIISGGSLGKEIDNDLVESGAISRRFPFQAQAASRKAINEGEIRFHDGHISFLSDDVAYGNYGKVDIAVVEAVAVGSDWFIPSTALGPTPAYVEAANQLIVEVNRVQPLALRWLHDVYRPATPPNRDPIPLTEPSGRIGDGKVEFDPQKLVAVVETKIPDSPYEFRDPTDADLAIAKNLVRFVQSEMEKNQLLKKAITLQFGVGSLGNALMSAFETVDFGERDVLYFGEVLQDGLLDMLDKGNLSSASATSLALSTEGQSRLFDNIDEYRKSIVVRPSDISNSPELIRRFGIVAVNTALEVDIYGHVNSTHINGSRLINGIGGSGDFIRNSHLAIVTLQSTAKGGNISRIVPMASHVDHTEHDVSVIVTEQGVADLRGLDPIERSKMIIEQCAHPKYRLDLHSYVNDASRKSGHIPHDLHMSPHWRTKD